MIEDKKTGAIIAENKKEAIWTKIKKAREITIEQMKNQIKKLKKVKKTPEKKIIKKWKEEMNEKIEEMKEGIEIEKVFRKAAEEQLK